jgi:oligopeptide transport system ATP-binding protein
MMKPLLTVNNLEVSFRLQKKLLHAVRGASFTLNEGEILGIVGESGCGKSAMAKALVKLLPNSAIVSGDVIYHDKNLIAFSEKQMQKIRGKHIASIFQDPITSLNPTIKIGTQIVEGYLRHHHQVPLNQARNYAIELLELVGIPHPEERINEYPHTLSGGMRQRVMIALALASQPKILIADEPTTALDVTIQAQILELMKKIKEKTGTSIILITHDMSVVAGFCDRVLVMYAGRIVESAPVEQLFDFPKHPYTKRLFESIPRLDMPKSKPLMPIEGTPPDLSQTIKGCAFCSRCSHPMNICAAQDPPLKELQAEHQIACWRELS